MMTNRRSVLKTVLAALVAPFASKAIASDPCELQEVEVVLPWMPQDAKVALYQRITEHRAFIVPAGGIGDKVLYDLSRVNRCVSEEIDELFGKVVDVSGELLVDIDPQLASRLVRRACLRYGIERG